MDRPDEPSSYPVAGGFEFLGRPGVMASLISAFDWSGSALGPVSDWSPDLKVAVSIVLQSPLPMTLIWGEEGILIYNEGYAAIAGSLHPAILGAKVRDAWPEHGAFNSKVMEACSAGATLVYRDQDFVLSRGGGDEHVWLDLFYHPVLDVSGRPCGAMAVLIETTERKQAERRNEQEHQRLLQLFEQAPAFMAMLSGPDLVFDMLNPECAKLLGGRDVIGLPMATAIPEFVEQGFLGLFDKTFDTGVPATRIGSKVMFQRAGGCAEERYLDFVLQPIRDETGRVTHIFVQGSDVTERVRGQHHQKLLIAELNHRVKNTLASVQSIVAQTLRSSEGSDDAREKISSRIMALSRTHDVLTTRGWEGADIDVIIGASLKPCHERAPGRIASKGPRVKLGTRAALSIAFAINELGMNAVAHGALRTETGDITIAWFVRGSGEDAELVVEWTETGGPPCEPPERSGFGKRVLLRALPLELGGKTKLDFSSSGVVFSAALPLGRVEFEMDGA